jgi:hypothetical protein
METNRHPTDTRPDRPNRAHPHARLASGQWLAFTGWESNPLDSIEKFLSVTSHFLLSQVYPGANTNLTVGPNRPMETFFSSDGPTYCNARFSNNAKRTPALLNCSAVTVVASET